MYFRNGNLLHRMTDCKTFSRDNWIFNKKSDYLCTKITNFNT